MLDHAARALHLPCDMHKTYLLYIQPATFREDQVHVAMSACALHLHHKVFISIYICIVNVGAVCLKSALLICLFALMFVELSHSRGNQLAYLYKASCKRMS